MTKVIMEPGRMVIDDGESRMEMGNKGIKRWGKNIANSITQVSTSRSSSNQTIVSNGVEVNVKSLTENGKTITKIFVDGVEVKEVING